MIPYGRQTISEQDIAAVVEVLGSDWLTQGPAIERFEAKVAEYCGAEFAVAVSNGTAALHAAVHAAGLGSRGLLWTSPVSFVASANCARYVGADVDFVDIDPHTLNMNPEALAAKLHAAETAGRLPDVVVPVHFGGSSADMRAIRELAEGYGFAIIEDAAHALGGRYGDTRVGSCAFSEMTTLSTHPVKLITTGEGGLVLTNDPELAERLRLFRSHGITRDQSRMRAAAPGPWYYEQVELGYNYRMTDIQAALGASQMDRLHEFVAVRNERAARYDAAFAGTGIGTQLVAPGNLSAYHLYVIRVAPEVRAGVFEGLREDGIGVNVHYIPIHLQPYYRDLGFAPGMFPNAEEYYAGAITIPLFPAMTDDEQDHVIERVRERVSNA